MNTIKNIQEVAPILQEDFINKSPQEEVVDKYNEFVKNTRLINKPLSKYLFNNLHDSEIIKIKLTNNILKVEILDIVPRLLAQSLINKFNLKINEDKLVFPVMLEFENVKEVSLNMVSENGDIISIDDLNIIKKADYLYDQLISFEENKIELAIIIWNNAGKYDKQLLLIINAENLKIIEKQDQQWNDIFLNKFNDLYSAFITQREKGEFFADNAYITNFINKNVLL